MNNRFKNSHYEAIHRLGCEIQAIAEQLKRRGTCPAGDFQHRDRMADFQARNDIAALSAAVDSALALLSVPTIYGAAEAFQVSDRLDKARREAFADYNRAMGNRIGDDGAIQRWTAMREAGERQRAAGGAS